MILLRSAESGSIVSRVDESVDNCSFSIRVLQNLQPVTEPRRIGVAPEVIEVTHCHERLAIFTFHSQRIIGHFNEQFGASHLAVVKTINKRFIISLTQRLPGGQKQLAYILKVSQSLRIVIEKFPS